MVFFCGKKNFRRFAKTFSAFIGCDISRKMLCVLCIFHKIRNGAGLWKKTEHFLVICRIAEIDNAFLRIFNAVMFLEIKQAHGKFVIVTEPGVDVDGAYVSLCADGFYRLENLFCFLKSELVVLIFRIVERKIVKAAVLVDAYFDFRVFGGETLTYKGLDNR